jgi:predicted metal-binding membrane protein
VPALRLSALRRRPTLAVELTVALAWLVTGAGGLGIFDGPAGGGEISSHSLWVCTLSGPAAGVSVAGAGPGGTAAPQLLAMLPMWGLMAVAMMLPTALPAARHVAVGSLYWRRRRAVVEYVVVFVALWAAFSALSLGLLWPLFPVGAAVAAPVLFAVAALWQWTPLKDRALRACHRPTPLPPYGWRATAGVARFGIGNGAACIASCWAMMLTMAVAGPARLPWMMALTVLISAEKLNLKPRRAARRIGVLLAAMAVATTVLALAVGAI